MFYGIRNSKKNKIRYTDCTKINDNNLKNIFNEYQPNLVVVATSDGLSIEKRITKISYQKKIPIISIIDFWSNYKKRYSTPNTKDLAYLPNKVCVIDDFMKAGAIRDGINSKIIEITGNPFFDTLQKVKTIEGDEIIFISQPFSEVYSKKDKIINKISLFNEVVIFKDYIEVLNQLKIKNPIVVSLHPRCKNKNKYNQFIKKSELNIKLSKEPIEKLVKNAKLVVGINSMVLFQASLIGKKVVSYQPGIIKKQDSLISNYLGLSYVAYSYSQLKKQLKKVLKNSKIKKVLKIGKFYTNSNSTLKVIKLINSFKRHV